MKRIAIAAAALGVLAIAGCNATTAAKTSSVATAAPGSTTSATPAAAPAPTPSPDGTFTGSCDYTLGSDPVGGTAVFVGEVDLANTGNVGTITRVKITWPQEGFSPIAAFRTVRTAAGQHKAVRFHRAADGNEVDLLQSWQTGHDYRAGCTYHATITGTYGAAH